MNDAANVKQQIVERVKQSSNILVTVSRDPSVDELAAALGLTIMLNNLKKHATAVVSGVIPSAIEFLEPGKTFENTVDSLRDFIIALDKEKADHLRYKVDGDVVKIFITPYRTTITEQDLDFSQGDYNVELVLALGVDSKDHLDAALGSHGRILHDAVVASLSAGDKASELGSLNWHESGASSVSEMLVSLSEALKGDKPVLDEQTATAFLTGIVASTDRFSNNKTSSKVMTMAAQLMAAGANQQLIAAKLEEANEISGDSSSKSATNEANTDGTTDLAEGTSSKINKKSLPKAKKSKQVEKEPESTANDGSLTIEHTTDSRLEKAAEEVNKQDTAEATEKAEDALASQLESVAPAAASASPSITDLQKDIAAASADVEQAAEAPSPAIDVSNSAAEVPMPDYEPTIGGTLNATTEQAAEDKRLEALNTKNRTILSHDNVGGGTAPASAIGTNTGPVFTPPPFSAATDSTSKPDDNIVSPFAPAPEPVAAVAEPVMPAPEPPALPVPPAPTTTLAELDEQNRGVSHDDARAAVAAAFADAPFNPANNPQASVGAQPLGDSPLHNEPASASAGADLPPLPDFTALPPPPPPIFASPAEVNVNQAPPEQLGQIFSDPPALPPAPQPSDPAQFKIPGQA